MMISNSPPDGPPQGPQQSTRAEANMLAVAPIWYAVLGPNYVWKAWGISDHRLPKWAFLPGTWSLTSGPGSVARSRVEGPVAIGFNGDQAWGSRTPRVGRG